MTTTDADPLYVKKKGDSAQHFPRHYKLYISFNSFIVSLQPSPRAVSEIIIS